MVKLKELINQNENITYHEADILLNFDCREYYIGQMGDKLRNRRTVHDQQIRDTSTRQLPLSSYLEQCSLINPNVSIFPFSQISQQCCFSEVI